MKLKTLFILISVILTLALISAVILLAQTNVTVEVSEPISPASVDVSYSSQEVPATIHYYIPVTNLASVDETISVSFTKTSETPQCGGRSIIINMPFTQIITSGITVIDTSITHNVAGSGCVIAGTVSIDRI